MMRDDKRAMIKKKVREFYDKQAIQWDEKYLNPFSRYTLKKEKSAIESLCEEREEKYARVLDIATGTGRYLDIIENGFVYAIDLSKNMLERAKRRSRKLENKNFFFSQCDAENLPFKDNSFDIILCVGLLSQVENTEKVLKEIKRTLKDDAYAIVKITNSFSFWSLSKMILEKFGKLEYPILRYYSIFKIEQICKRNNLKIVRKRGIVIFPVLLYLNSKTIKLKFLYKISEKIENFLNEKFPYFMRGFILRLEVEEKKSYR